MKIVDAFERQPFRVAQEDANYLAARLLGNLERRGDQISISRHVGHLKLPSGDVLRLRTGKARATSLLAWLAYVDPTLAPALLLEVVPDAAADGDVGCALAWLYVTELLRALAETGLIRRYQRITSRGSTVRGRIDFTALVRQGGNIAQLPCHVWERQTRSPLNETLRAGLEVVHRSELMRMTVEPKLRRLLGAFAEIAPRADTQLLSGATALNRTEQRFATSLRFARLLLHGSAIGDGDHHSGVGFLLNIEQLFEDAVLRALRGSGQRVDRQHPLAYGIRTGAKASQGNFSIDAYCQFVDKNVVVDAKFKREASASNLQQMVAYCFMTGATRAVLVLPAEFATDTAFTFVAPQSGRTITVNIVGLKTEGTSIASWRAAGQSMALEICALCAGES